MICLLITNRPRFAKLAVAQIEKCKWVTPIVLVNGIDPSEFKFPDSFIIFYKKDWKNGGDAFNWFRLQKEYHNQDLFITDDDIILHQNPIPIINKYFEFGWDRICFSKIGTYDTRTKESGIHNWPPERLGFCVAIRRNLWHRSVYKSIPDGVMYYINNLPYHNCKISTELIATHLIHGENIINKENCISRIVPWEDKHLYLEEVKKEVELYL